MAEIRSETVDDAEAVDAILRAAFPTPVEARLVRRLRSNGNLVVSRVCVEEGRIVGHIAFSPVSINQKVSGPSMGLGLGPVAVLPEHQRKGFGEQLVDSGMVAARDIGCEFVVVLGDPHYYSRFGFEAASKWGLVDEYGGGEAFQAQELVPGSIPDGGGLVKYGAEFSTLIEEGTA